jgi:hypothetical protein
VLERALARRFLLLLLGEALALLLEPRRVVAFPRDARAPIQLEDPAATIVEEVAVVGDGHHRARILLEVSLEPRHAFRVQVVGRLVEQEHVRLLEEEPAEGHAPDLAAREGGDVRIAGRTAQRIHGDLDRPVEVPSVGGLDGVLHPGLLARAASPSRRRPGLAELGVDLVEAREEPRTSATPSSTLPRTSLSDRAGLLRQVADTQSVGGTRLAEEIRVDAGHDAEQRALARAVGAEHADLGARDRTTARCPSGSPAWGDDLAEVLHEVDELMGHRPCIIPGGARFH